MYAIIATGGKQYKVSEGDIIKVEKLDAEAGATVTFDQVIAVSDGTLKVGADVENASVAATVLTTEALVVSIPEKTPAAPAGGGMGGGMDGMY